MARVHCRLVVPLLLILAVSTTITTGAAAKTTRCPADFGGGTCRKCKTVDGGAVACAKCRPNSVWKDDYSACVCDYEKDYGTVSKEMFDAYADEARDACRRRGRRHCKVPSYSSVAGKCVPCPSYLNSAASLNGECVPLAGSGSSPGTTCPEIRGSKAKYFEIINNTPYNIIIYTVPGWQCRDSNRGGFSGVSTPASLDKLLVPAYGSIRPRLEVQAVGQPNSRFGLRFYSGTNPPTLMPIADPSNNVMWIAHQGSTGSGDTWEDSGWSMEETPGGREVCDPVPTTLIDGTEATMQFSCGFSNPKVTFAVK